MSQCHHPTAGQLLGPTRLFTRTSKPPAGPVNSRHAAFTTLRKAQLRPDDLDFLLYLPPPSSPPPGPRGTTLLHIYQRIISSMNPSECASKW